MHSFGGNQSKRTSSSGEFEVFKIHKIGCNENDIDDKESQLEAFLISCSVFEIARDQMQ